MKKILLNALFAALATIFTACDTNQNAKISESNAPDSEKIIKIFGANPPITALLQILYPQGLIALNYTPYPEDKPFMPANVVNLPVLGMIGGGKQINFEKTISQNPNIIFVNSGVPSELKAQYEGLGVQVVELDDVFNAANFTRNIDKIAEFLPIAQRAQKLKDFVRKSQNLISESGAKIPESSRPSIYFAFGMDGLQTMCAPNSEKLDSEKNIFGDVARKIGGKNAFDCTAEQMASINYEMLLAKNPQVIFVREIALYNELKNAPNAHWAQIDAIKNGKIFYMPSSPSNWLFKPPSIMQVLGEPLAFSFLHPDIIAPDFAKELVMEFFSEFLVEISESDYEKLLNGAQK